MKRTRQLDLRDEEDEEERQQQQKHHRRRGGGGGAKPVGRATGASRNGKGVWKHYASVEFKGNVYELGDSVLLSSGEEKKPYVAIIKDITEDVDGNVMVTGQWFFRPEEAEREGGGKWEARDSRELFYSFHLYEVPAEFIMHKSVVHFIPLHKQLPVRSQHPGYIVQRVYDAGKKKLWKLIDKDYEEIKQHEIDVLVEQTRTQIGEPPDIVLENCSAKKSDNSKSKRNLGRNTLYPIDASRVEPTTGLDKLAEAYGSSKSDVSKYHKILSEFKVLTGDIHRDKWLEKLLQGIQTVCNSKDAMPMDDKQKNNGLYSDVKVSGKHSGLCVSHGRGSCVSVKMRWPNSVIPIITTLERVTYEALGIDFQKYNQKMRQLDFNIKSNVLLVRRLLKKELEPIALLTMTPDELKEGLTADERITIEHERPGQLQMTDARCVRCMEKQVGVTGIIHAGRLGERYQLECIECGNTWYASQDFMSCNND